MIFDDICITRSICFLILVQKRARREINEIKFSELRLRSRETRVCKIYRAHSRREIDDNNIHM